MNEEVLTSSKIKIAHLPKENEPCPTGRSLVISGWGWDLMRPFRSLDNLYAVTRECLDASNCPRLKDMNPKNNLLCVGDTEIPLNSECKVDSGGI